MNKYSFWWLLLAILVFGVLCAVAGFLGTQAFSSSEPSLATLTKKNVVPSKVPISHATTPPSPSSHASSPAPAAASKTQPTTSTPKPTATPSAPASEPSAPSTSAEEAPPVPLNPPLPEEEENPIIPGSVTNLTLPPASKFFKTPSHKILDAADPSTYTHTYSSPSYSVQLGAFRKINDAKTALKEFPHLRPYIVQSWQSNNQMWYLVRYGPFNNFEKANNAALSFKNRYKKGAIAFKNQTTEKRVNTVTSAPIRKKANVSSS